MTEAEEKLEALFWELGPGLFLRTFYNLVIQNRVYNHADGIVANLRDVRTSQRLGMMGEL